MKTMYTPLFILLILIIPFAGKSQYFTISGKVLDNINGKALKNVSVFESNSNIGTITDNKGMFKLILTGGPKNIEIVEHGFKTFSEQLVLKSDTILIVELKPDNHSRSWFKSEVKLHADTKTSTKTTAKRLLKRSRR